MFLGSSKVKWNLIVISLLVSMNGFKILENQVL